MNDDREDEQEKDTFLFTMFLFKVIEEHETKSCILFPASGCFGEENKMSATG